MPPKAIVTIPLATQIQAARVAKNLTQTELSAQTGIAQSTIARYESGARDPNLPNLRTLAKALSSVFLIGPA
jgi:transcriptional regulator with XRE-family HTH domain